jgi:hypothetical protein
MALNLGSSQLNHQKTTFLSASLHIRTSRLHTESLFLKNGKQRLNICHEIFQSNYCLKLKIVITFFSEFQSSRTKSIEKLTVNFTKLSIAPTFQVKDNQHSAWTSPDSLAGKMRLFIIFPRLRKPGWMDEM